MKWASLFVHLVRGPSGETAISQHRCAMPIGLLLLGSFLLAGSPLVQAADEFPRGCVSCHVAMKDQGDKRLGPLLAEAGHVSIKGKVASVPADCIACHAKKSDTKFAVLIHQTHFAAPSDNDFVQHFGGDCRHCHVMDVEAGEARLKTGDANW